MSAPFRFPRFFVTTPSPCPYLPGKTERKVFTELARPHAAELNDALGPDRLPPQPVRRLSAELHRLLRLRLGARRRRRVQAQRHPAQADPRATPISRSPPASRGRPTSNIELLRRYLARAPSRRRHGRDGRAATLPTWSSRRRSTPIVIEYREPSDGRPPRQAGRRLPDRPAGRWPVDDLQLLRCRACRPRPGLGTYIILDHILRAARAGLPYVYLGYWVEGSAGWPTRRFRPIERLGPTGWCSMDAPSWPPSPSGRCQRAPRGGSSSTPRRSSPA